ncbi:hypothetical protein MMC07_004830 [Pseudocyphellaria aurata]|nr:hypothetical protein [Pseudocyphellaria aurata]
MPPTSRESSIIRARDALEAGNLALARIGRLQDMIAMDARIAAERRTAFEGLEDRTAEEVNAIIEAQQAREVRLFRSARDSGAFAPGAFTRLARELPLESRPPAARTAAFDEPLEINRATTLLACICLLRINRPGWPSALTASILRLSFPEFFIRARDIEVLFSATCRNRPRWVHAMRPGPNMYVDSVRHAYCTHQREITRPVLELLRLNRFADTSLFPREHYAHHRGGIYYLQRLVGVSHEDFVVENVPTDSDEYAWERRW